MIFLLRCLWLKLRGPKYKLGIYKNIPWGIWWLHLVKVHIETRYHKPFYLYTLNDDYYQVSEGWITEQLEAYETRLKKS